MNALDLLLATALVTFGVMLVVGGRRGAGWVGLGLYALQLLLVVHVGLELDAPQARVASAVELNVFGNPLRWEMDGLGWFFAAISVGIALFCTWYASGEWAKGRGGMRRLHANQALNVWAMLVLLSSADLLSLFIGWELTSWAGFLMMTQSGGEAARAAYRYLMYAMAGAMAVLAALVLAQIEGGSLQLEAVRSAFGGFSVSLQWTLVLLFFAGFAVKVGMLPFHLWQARAYSETPAPGAAFLGAITGRMGLFAMFLVLIKVFGLDSLIRLDIPFTFLDARDLLAWVSALTIIVPTYIALTQTDGRMLLAWHGIGQGGYMLLGVVVGSELGVAGGLLHVFNYATYQAPLLLSVFAVMHRTGTADLDRLGGLITRMPLCYVTMLLGIIGLAGLPPMNGFVSKWLVYKSLLDAHMPLLFVAAVIGTLGTILSVYKLIHNTFLGQLRKEHMEVREAPWSMSLPMLAMVVLAFVTGWMPGLALDLVDKAQGALGFALLEHHLGGVDLPNGSLDMLWVGGMLFVALGVGALIYFSGNRSYRVDQLDNYAGGHFLSAEVQYHYSHNFYPGLMRVIGSWYRGSVVWLEQGLVSLTRVASSAMQGIYRSASTPVYLLVAAVIGLWLMAGY